MHQIRKCRSTVQYIRIVLYRREGSNNKKNLDDVDTQQARPGGTGKKYSNREYVREIDDHEPEPEPEPEPESKPPEKGKKEGRKVGRKGFRLVWFGLVSGMMGLVGSLTD